MKLILPNSTVVMLDDNLTEEARKIKVDEILQEWGSYFSKTWNLNKTKICLDILSTYLNKDKKKKGEETDGKEKTK